MTSISWIRRLSSTLLLTVLCLLSPSTLRAQDNEQSSWLADIAKRVAFDPTTYAPAIIGYDATMRDWNSSQPFFNAGFVERNSRFTINGLPNGVAVDYTTGKRRILTDGIGNLEMSLANNFASAILERAMTNRYPEHRKLIKVVGWIERVGLASLLSYNLSSKHYRQWQENERTAAQLGLR